MDDTILIPKTPQEAAGMLDVFATALGKFGLEVGVPEAGPEIDPNQPGAKMTALRVNCTGDGVKLQAAVDPATRVCPFIRQGTWKWLGRMWDPEGTWEGDPPTICAPWAVFSKSRNLLLNKNASL